MARTKEITKEQVIQDFANLNLLDQVAVFKIIEKTLQDKAAERESELQLLDSVNPRTVKGS